MTNTDFNAELVALGFTNFEDGLDGFIKECEEFSKNRNPRPGSLTGFKELDDNILINKGNFVLIGGRPSMGKTTFSLQMFFNMYINDREKKPSIFFTSEMNNCEIMERLIVSATKIPFTNIKNGTLSPDEFHKLAEFSRKFAEDKRTFLCDDTNLNVETITKYCDKIKMEHREIGSIFIDRIQNIGTEKNFHPLDDTEENRRSEVTQQLKALARRLQCPVIATTQLDSRIEKRLDKRPTMRDIAGLGTVEYDANIILGIYRNEVYNDLSPSLGSAEIIILKNTHGFVGKIELAFLKEYPAFFNLSKNIND